MTTIGTPPAKFPSLPFPLQEGEQVLMFCRRHWLYLWPRLLLILAVAFLPPLAAGWLLSAADAYEGVIARVFWVAAGVWLIYWGVRAFLTWYRYNNDIWVITSQRLIDSLKKHPFNLEVATADLVNVQDITVERSGVLRTIFDFGDILCQTAAERQAFVLAGIPDPRAVQGLIDRERDRERLRYRA
ncbi:MAG TPA: hypothetical protein VNN10_13820 [Dehalococcoidia bacterium]|nr:hypothetical protein [Dehalococcoidia bacterium]